MSTIQDKDRASLCTFTFADGRRCRTPLHSGHPHLCYFHARKQAQAQAAQQLGRDCAFFFSGDYLSACSLAAALRRLFPAVLRGEVKPRTARNLAYLAQTMLQTIRLAQHEFTSAFGDRVWLKTIQNHVRGNYKYMAQAATQNAPQPAPQLADQAPQPAPQPPDQVSQPAQG